MPERNNNIMQNLIRKIAAMEDKDQEIMLLLATAYAAGKASAAAAS